MFIYPRRRVSHLLEKGGPEGAVCNCSNNEWTNEELFIVWLEHFTKHAKPTEEDPVLLILDNHSSHKTIHVYEFCKRNSIVLVSIPRHTSHRMQPLDITFFGPLKCAFNTECDCFMKSHPHRKITPYELAGIFNKAYIRVAAIEKAVAGFSSTGIRVYPLDPCKFSEDDFALAAGLNQQPTSVIHDAELDEEQPLNEAKKQQEASVAESTCSEEPFSELPVAGALVQRCMLLTFLLSLPGSLPHHLQLKVEGRNSTQKS
jgi:hypothetical protein